MGGDGVGVDGGAVGAVADRAVGLDRHRKPEAVEFPIARDQSVDHPGIAGLVHGSPRGETGEIADLPGATLGRCPRLADCFHDRRSHRFGPAGGEVVLDAAAGGRDAAGCDQAPERVDVGRGEGFGQAARLATADSKLELTESELRGNPEVIGHRQRAEAPLAAADAETAVRKRMRG